MMMPGRKYQAGSASYRYSINGQEKSSEINENLTTAEFWQYDSRIGRRWNKDPRPTTGVSPYSTFINNPILLADPLGDTTINGQKMEGVNANSATTLKEVIVTSRSKKIPNKTNNPKYQGWGEVRDVGVRKLEKNIERINTSLNTSGFNMDRIDIEMLEGKRSINTGGKNILGSVNTGLDIWDVGVGMHAFATKGANADIFSTLPLVGGIFSAANDITDENEKMIVRFALGNGYSDFLQMLTHSTVGSRSGLTGVYLSTDVLKLVIKQGYLDLNLTQVGRIGSTDALGYDLRASPPVKFDYFLVIPRTRENKVTQFIPLKIK
jgi:hypothetical protein